MYANIFQGPCNGILGNKHKLPRFPVSQEEFDRLAGITTDAVYDCQQATDLTDFQGNYTLTKNLTPTNEIVCPNIPRKGIKTTPGSTHYYQNIAFARPITTSFMFGVYVRNHYDGNAAQAVGERRADVAAGLTYIDIRTDGAVRAVIQDTAASTYVIAPSDATIRDGKPVGLIAIYDAPSTTLGLSYNGAVSYNSAIATWLGFGDVAMAVALGSLYGSAARTVSEQYSFFAHGAQLDGYYLTGFTTLSKRLGWS